MANPDDITTICSTNKQRTKGTGDHRESSHKTAFMSLIHSSLTLVLFKMKLYKKIY